MAVLGEYMRAYSVRARMVLLLVVVCAAIGSLTVTSFLGQKSMHDAVEDLIQGPFHLSTEVTKLTEDAMNQRRFEKDVLISTGDVEAQKKYLAKWQQTNTRLRETLMRVQSAHPTKADLLKPLLSSLDTYEQEGLKVLQAIAASTTVTVSDANGQLKAAKTAHGNLEASLKDFLKALEADSAAGQEMQQAANDRQTVLDLPRFHGQYEFLQTIS